MIVELHPIVDQFVEWRKIRQFTDYSISSTGTVRNDESGRRMSMLVNQAGVVHVGLTKNRTQYKRAVALLVVKAFLTVVMHDSFDTPINLNGDRFNNEVDNLTLRPRWYATKYFRQFDEGPYDAYAVEDVQTRERFDSIWDAAIRFGLLQSDIAISVHTGRPVWPTSQIFRSID
jgi:hypothetical protein